MKIESKFNLRDKVLASTVIGNQYVGIITKIAIGPTLALTYDVLANGGYALTCKEFELTAIVEDKPDSIYYAKVHKLNYRDLAKDKVLIFPTSYISEQRHILDNVKITYDSNGIFKDIEKI